MQINTKLSEHGNQNTYSPQRVMLTNKTPKPTLFHNLKSQRYLAEDNIPLSARESQNQNNNYSNLLLTTQKPHSKHNIQKVDHA